MNVLGTKLACEECGAQAVVIKGGDGELTCHGRPMVVIAGEATREQVDQRQRSGEITGADSDYYSSDTS